mmetsp:Transcript_143656/g.358070  ORF Transcript_143656/g.358070 Transcript_143656/m.358070 type:complete len:258 (-) Transcript_143656:193-966(-)
MDFVKAQGLSLTNKAGAAVPASDLSGKVVALYFSAHWCPPCKGFTPVLKAFYEEVKKSGPFEIIFVSGDKSEAEGKSYFTNDHGDWLMADFAQGAAVSDAFRVQGIPSLIVIDAAGKPVDPDARAKVADAAKRSFQGAKDVYEEWAKSARDWRQTAGTSLGGAAAASDKDAMRAARLARLGGGPPVAAAAAAPTPAPAPSPATAAPSPQAAAPENPSVDSAALAQLMSMGFAEEKARQALVAADGNVETATSILLES